MAKKEDKLKISWLILVIIIIVLIILFITLLLMYNKYNNPNNYATNSLPNLNPFNFIFKYFNNKISNVYQATSAPNAYGYGYGNCLDGTVKCDVCQFCFSGDLSVSSGKDVTRHLAGGDININIPVTLPAYPNNYVTYKVVTTTDSSSIQITNSNVYYIVFPGKPSSFNIGVVGQVTPPTTITLSIHMETCYTDSKGNILAGTVCSTQDSTYTIVTYSQDLKGKCVIKKDGTVCTTPKNLQGNCKDGVCVIPPICGDLIVQYPDSQGIYEECDKSTDTPDCWMNPSSSINIFGYRCKTRGCGDYIKEINGPDQNPKTLSDNEACDSGKSCMSQGQKISCNGDNNLIKCDDKSSCKPMNTKTCWMDASSNALSLKCQSRECGDKIAESAGPDGDIATIDDNEDCDPGKFCSDLKTSCLTNDDCKNIKTIINGNTCDNNCLTRETKSCSKTCKTHCDMSCNTITCPESSKCTKPDLKSCDNSIAMPYITNNFIVNTMSPAGNPGSPIQACELGLQLEYELCINAANYGVTIDLSKNKCEVNIKIGATLGGGGDVLYASGNPNPPVPIRMKIQGNFDDLMNSVIPHETNHIALAFNNGGYPPRWVDEGLATMQENTADKCKQWNSLKNAFYFGSTFSFDKLFSTVEYPSDVSSFYAESWSLSEYLVELGGGGCSGERSLVDNSKLIANDKDKFLAKYNVKSTQELQDNWVAWVKDKISKGCSPCSCIDPNKCPNTN